MRTGPKHRPPHSPLRIDPPHPLLIRDVFKTKGDIGLCEADDGPAGGAGEGDEDEAEGLVLWGLVSGWVGERETGRERGSGMREKREEGEAEREWGWEREEMEDGGQGNGDESERVGGRGGGEMNSGG